MIDRSRLTALAQSTMLSRTPSSRISCKRRDDSKKCLRRHAHLAERHVGGIRCPGEVRTKWMYCDVEYPVGAWQSATDVAFNT